MGIRHFISSHGIPAMKLSRRAFVGTLAAIALGGCSRVIDELAQPDLPNNLEPPGGADRHPIAHLLNRATYGPRPGQIAEVERLGRERWLEQQLDYDNIRDTALDWRLRRYDTLQMKPRDLLSFGRDQWYVANELARATLIRAIFSERQLYEVMVGFWSDHFSIYHFKNDMEIVVFLKTVDDREVIRRHALGKFGDLLRASAHSPAMLYYLDNTSNEQSHPNENYAREIMELHTLGVDGGYTERDIQEVARCFTGWTADERGEFTFKGEWHDLGAKTVLGHEIPARGGKEDGDRVLDILTNHPSTARFICTKLVRRFVADNPPTAIIEACVKTWNETEGDIRCILRTLFNHPDFDNAPSKFKRPFEYVVSLLRATNANYDGDADLITRLEQMGQRPFAWVTPDGYPDEADIWANNIFSHWEFARDLAEGSIPGVEVDLWKIAEHVGVHRDAERMLAFFGRLMLKRDLNDQEKSALQDFLSKQGPVNLRNDADRQRMSRTLGLLFQVPAYQWR